MQCHKNFLFFCTIDRPSDTDCTIHLSFFTRKDKSSDAGVDHFHSMFGIPWWRKTPTTFGQAPAPASAVATSAVAAPAIVAPAIVATAPAAAVATSAVAAPAAAANNFLGFADVLLIGYFGLISVHLQASSVVADNEEHAFRLAVSSAECALFFTRIWLEKLEHQLAKTGLQVCLPTSSNVVAGFPGPEDFAVSLFEPGTTEWCARRAKACHVAECFFRRHHHVGGVVTDMLYHDEHNNQVRTPACRFMDWAPVLLTHVVVRHLLDRRDKLQLVKYFEWAYSDLEEAFAAGWLPGFGSLCKTISLAVEGCVERKRADADAVLKMYKNLDCAVLLRSDSDCCLEDHWLVFPKLASPVPPEVTEFISTVPKETLKDPWVLQMTGKPSCPYAMVFVPFGFGFDLRSVHGLF